MFIVVFCLLAQINAQNMNCFVKNLFSKCEHIRTKLRIYSHLLYKSLTENFIFCVVNIIGFTTESFKFFFKPNSQSLVCFTSINTWHRLLPSLLFRNQFLALVSIILLSRWLVFRILVILTKFVVWLVHCNRFSWIIVIFLILIKLLAFTFFLKDISPSLIFVIQNVLISNNF